MYVAVKGGEQAIDAAHALLDEERRGSTDIPELSIAQIKTQLKLSVDRVMAEASLYEPTLAALAIKQAHGELQEAIFLLRAYRTTLPRFGVSEALNTGKMYVSRRISATWKDLPGGQILGSTFDYTHRLLDRSLLDGKNTEPQVHNQENASKTAIFPPDAHLVEGTLPRALEALSLEGILEATENSCPETGDITRQALELPANTAQDRALRLQSLARADEGFLLSMAYSTQRGFGAAHPFTGELRRGMVELSFIPEELGFAVCVGEIEITECEIVSQYTGTAKEPCFVRGYGLVFGNNERKALSMGIADRALRANELQEAVRGPAQNAEFMLLHGDNVEAAGFVQHIKLPHYVDFQAELSLIRGLRHARQEQCTASDNSPASPSV